MLPAVGIRTQIWNNAIRSVLLIVAFPIVLPIVVLVALLLLFLCANDPLASTHASVIAFAVMLFLVVVGAVWFPIAWFGAQAIVDALTGARPLSRSNDRPTWNLLENLCISCGMQMPALNVIEANELNAYASGTTAGTVTVTVTRGLLSALTADELQGVLAHELSHIRNRDVRLMMIATIFVGLVPLARDLAIRVFSWLTNGFAALYEFILTRLLRLPVAGLMARLGYGLLFILGQAFAVAVTAFAIVFNLLAKAVLSRQREFMADAGAVLLTRNPDAMISALRKVACHSDLPVPAAGLRDMFFDNPHLTGISGLFSTHPPISARISALERLKFSGIA